VADIFGVVKSGNPPVPTNGATIKAWLPSQVPGGVLPPENTAEPNGTPAGSAVSGTNYGSDGAFLITGLASGTYLVSWTLNATTYWAEFQALRSTPGFDHIFINDSGGISVGETTDKVGAGNSGAWVTGMGHFTNDLWANALNAFQQWGPNPRNPGVWLSNDGTDLYGMFVGHDNVAYGTALLGTSYNPFVLLGYHNAGNAPQMNQIGYGLRFQADVAGINFAQGTPGTPPTGAGTAPDWAHEPRLYLQPTVAGSGDGWSGRMNLRAAHLRIGPQDSTVRYAYSGLYSALLVLERSADANDASILFKSFSPNQTYWSFELPGTNDLHVKKVTGTHSPYAEQFTSLAWWQYTSGFMSVGTDDNIAPAGQLYVRSRNPGDRAFVVDTVASPTANVAEFRGGGGAARGLPAAHGRTGAGAPAPAAPVSQLHLVSTDTGNPRGVTLDQFSTSADSANLSGRKARGTPSSPAAVQNGDVQLSLAAAAYDGSAYQWTGYAEWVVNGAVAAGSVPTDFVVGTGANNFGTEWLRLSSSGNHRLSGGLEITGGAAVDGRLTISTTDALAGGQAQFIAQRSNSASVGQSSASFMQNIAQHASGNLPTVIALDVWNQYGGTSTANPAVSSLYAVRGLNAITNASPVGVIGSAAALDANSLVWLGSGTPNVTVQTNYGLFVGDMAASPVAGVTVQNSYGVYIAAQSAGRYALYVAGNNPSAFFGPVEFHNQTTAGTAGALGGYIVFQVNGGNVKIPWYNM
jgi:hypothetical protein